MAPERHMTAEHMTTRANEPPTERESNQATPRLRNATDGKSALSHDEISFHLLMSMNHFILLTCSRITCLTCDTSHLKA